MWPPRTELNARFDSQTVHLVWEVTLRCNLNCTYCFGHTSSGPVQSVFDEVSVEQTAQTLLEACGDRRLLFDMTGGEPMLVDQLFELVERLPPEQCHFRFQTNGTVYRQFRPSLLNVAYHPQSMTANQNEAWWKNLARYAADGHAVSAQLIALPDSLDELEEVHARLSEVVGEEGVYVRYLLGRMGERQFPQQYSREELARIRPLMRMRVVEEELLRIASWNFRGRPCRAGSELAVISRTGEVFRCTGAMGESEALLGSLQGGFAFHSREVRPCQYQCSCTHQGLWYCLGI
jgi:organic radical activating enzyme